MKNLLKVLFAIGIASLNCYTSCEDECDKTKIDKVDNVELFVWGDVVFRDQNMNDVTSNYTGTEFKALFNKYHCNGNTSSDMEYIFHSLSDGALDRHGSITWDFHFDNTKDKINLYAFVKLPDGSNLQLSEIVFDEDIWGVGVIRARMLILFRTDNEGNVNWEQGALEWYINESY